MVTLHTLSPLFDSPSAQSLTNNFIIEPLVQFQSFDSFYTRVFSSDAWISESKKTVQSPGRLVLWSLWRVIRHFFPFAYPWSPLVWKECLVGEHFWWCRFLVPLQEFDDALLAYLNIILYKESDYFRKALTPWSKSNNSPLCSWVRKPIALGKCTVQLKFVTRWQTVFRTNAMFSNDKVGISTLHLWWKHQLLPSFHILISPTSTCHLINQ